MIIICTGMDNTGKTTLTERMAKDLNVKIQHSPGPISKEEQEHWMYGHLVEEMVEGGIHLYDRFTSIEELVYGPELRGKSNFYLNDLLFMHLKVLKPVIVYTRPPRELIFNFGEREQMEGVIEHKENLLQKYDDLMFRLMALGWKVIVYDYTTNNDMEKGYEDLMNKILN